jgi:hypothetical protein
MSTATQTRLHVKHWREKFDPSAELVFTKTFTLGLPNQRVAEAGQIVSPEVREQIGEQRLKMWYRSRFIGMAEQRILPEQAEKAPQPIEPAPVEEPGSMTHTGGGWYEVTLPSGETRRVRGKAKAKALLV